MRVNPGYAVRLILVNSRAVPIDDIKQGCNLWFSHTSDNRGSDMATGKTIRTLLFGMACLAAHPAGA